MGFSNDDNNSRATVGSLGLDLIVFRSDKMKQELSDLIKEFWGVEGGDAISKATRQQPSLVCVFDYYTAEKPIQGRDQIH